MMLFFFRNFISVMKIKKVCYLFFLHFYLQVNKKNILYSVKSGRELSNSHSRRIDKTLRSHVTSLEQRFRSLYCGSTVYM